MTASVHRLPDPMIRQWGVLEQDLRELLVHRYRLLPVEVEHALRVLRSLWLQHARRFEATATADNAEAAVAELNEWVRGVMAGALLEVAVREIELFRAGLRG